MALIKTIEPENATGELKELYDQILKLRGRIPNSSKMWSISPELYKQQIAFIEFYMKHETLTMPLLACVRILVSAKNSCAYCVDFNSAMLVNLAGWSAKDVDELKTTGKSTKLSEKEQKMLDFIAKSVKECKKADESELNALRTLGWSDKDILDGLQHGARMSAIDIIFNVFDIENDN